MILNSLECRAFGSLTCQLSASHRKAELSIPVLFFFPVERAFLLWSTSEVWRGELSAANGLFFSSTGSSQVPAVNEPHFQVRFLFSSLNSWSSARYTSFIHVSPVRVYYIMFIYSLLYNSIDHFSHDFLKAHRERTDRRISKSLFLAMIMIIIDSADSESRTSYIPLSWVPNQQWLERGRKVSNEGTGGLGGLELINCDLIYGFCSFICLFVSNFYPFMEMKSMI